MNRYVIKFLSLSTLFLVFTACKSKGPSGQPGQSGSQTAIKADGSSTVFPISAAIAEEFQKSKSGKIKITVGISGTGGGFKKFCRGEIDVQNASRPIQEKEIEACKAQGIQFVELPVAFDALTVVVNPANPLNSISVADLKKMWAPEAQGQIMQWNQVNPEWPANPLKLYGAGSDSGTFDYFTEAIVGKSKSSRGDYSASEDDNVLVKGIERDKNALGYFGYAYYIENKDKLKVLAIDNGKGPVVPSPETVENGSYHPLARPVFIYVNQKSAQRPEVKEFVEFYLKQAPDIVKQVKYIPLPAEIYTQVTERFKQAKIGTAFSGHSETNLSIHELMKKEPK